jgi:tetratricopeptide (TPR) repeat protein
VLKARALFLRASGRFADAVAATTTVIDRNPGEPFSYKEIGLNKLYLGETQEAAEWFRRADAIAPRDPDRWMWLQGLGRALMQLGQDAEAVDVLSQAMESNPSYLRGKAWLAAAEALAGDVERAGLHLADYIALEPQMTVRPDGTARKSRRKPGSRATACSNVTVPIGGVSGSLVTPRWREMNSNQASGSPPSFACRSH